MNTYIINIWDKPGYDWIEGTVTIVTEAENLSQALGAVSDLESIYENMWDEPDQSYDGLPINFRVQMVTGSLVDVSSEDIKREITEKLDNHRDYVKEGLREEEAREKVKALQVAALRKQMAEHGITVRDLEDGGY